MLDSQQQIVQQAIDYLVQCSDNHYTRIPRPHFAASPGMHMRHVLDHYQALMRGLASKHVDYNQRQRQSAVESQRTLSIQNWQQISHWLTQLCPDNLRTTITVTSEIALDAQQQGHATSTLARELIFVSSHAVHHFSLLAVMASQDKQRVPAHFGVAPATLTYQREQAG